MILGPPGVGKSHLAVGLAMEALRAGYLVRYTTLDDLVRELRQADQLGTLRTKLSHYQRPHLLIVDEVGYMRLEHADANRIFQLINRRYTRSSMIVTSNKRVSEWAALFGDEVLAAAILDRLLHDAEILTINGPSWRLRGRGDILDDSTNSTPITAKTTRPIPLGDPAKGLRSAHTTPTEPADPLNTPRSEPTTHAQRPHRRPPSTAHNAAHTPTDRHFSMALDRCGRGG